MEFWNSDKEKCIFCFSYFQFGYTSGESRPGVWGRAVK